MQRAKLYNGNLMKITNVEPISLIVTIENDIKAPISIPHVDELETIVFKEYRTSF